MHSGFVKHHDRHHYGKVGHAIYRCSYDDEHIKDRLRAREEENGPYDGEDNEATRTLQDSFTRNGQDDEAQFNDASTSKIRR
ncbi:hypothetical protein AC579_9899 [Pseudocercospora musae]|uniref:Uncharacterized protein n=1 Tax=Pseudocercospora musae TaxID=113226 RepID=A0A139H1T2_9PEZI|nr:hypothetical protein AC579_9899 [Pseudocercospora musae]